MEDTEEDESSSKRHALSKLLRESGLDERNQEMWLAYLGTLEHASDDDLALVLAPGEDDSFAPRTSNLLRRRLTIFRHEVRRWWASRKLWVRVAYTISFLNLPVASAIKLGFSLYTGISTCFFLLMFGWGALKQFEPDHMRLLERGYDRRKLTLQKLIVTMQSWYDASPSSRELQAFRQETLGLIADYMRAHRSDIRGTKIFANLLLEEGDYLVVVARSDLHRETMAKYPKEGMLVWDAIKSGEAKHTGDLYADFPHTQPGKVYRSIFVIPVIGINGVDGAVSIDSEALFHFDKYSEDIPTHLAPYVQLLSATLSGALVTNMLRSANAQDVSAGKGDGDADSDESSRTGEK